MSNLSDKYTKLLLDIESHISDEKEKRYIMQKIDEIGLIYVELIDRLSKVDDDRISNIEKKEQDIEKRLAKIQETVTLIKNDIYEDDDMYDFEIVCPYCNHEFVADVEDELKEEIECPECHNIIELDWNDDKCSNCNKDDCNSKSKNNQIIDNSNNDQDNNEDDM